MENCMRSLHADSVIAALAMFGSFWMANTDPQA